ncbi:MAG TPA: isoprenylcysteine carboxylmethyltransferase family protein [Bryobacteraceae bacterium]|nr:isoprenylcysteine carboxylmethyltransferase family protein [Bryobacteraceae bacterium]
MRPRSRFPKAYADFVQRLRVVFGFLLLAAFAWLSQPTLESMLIGIPISSLGLFLRAWAAGHLAKDRQLATSGPYAYVRNPLYLGTLIAALGIVVASRSLWLAFIFAMAFMFVYLPAIELEEQHLREIFPEYAPYAAQVHRFLPSLGRAANGTRFRWTFYRRNEEYKALLGFVTALAWLIWKGLHFQTL